jgi:hypothetical protein
MRPGYKKFQLKNFVIIWRVSVKLLARITSVLCCLIVKHMVMMFHW